MPLCSGAFYPGASYACNFSFCGEKRWAKWKDNFIGKCYFHSSLILQRNWLLILLLNRLATWAVFAHARDSSWRECQNLYSVNCQACFTFCPSQLYLVTFCLSFLFATFFATSSSSSSQLSRSNKRSVFLKHIDLHSQGVYRCEVSAEAPSFNTAELEREMKVYGKLTKERWIIKYAEYKVQRVEIWKTFTTCILPSLLSIGQLLWAECWTGKKEGKELTRASQ